MSLPPQPLRIVQDATENALVKLSERNYMGSLPDTLKKKNVNMVDGW
jgi:hypothetical protein